MNWLFKEEPTHYNFDDLVKDKKTVWSGVKNPLAQKHLRSVQNGDRIFYYHTGDEKAVVGWATVVSSSRVETLLRELAERRIEPPVTLRVLKADPLFAESPLVRISRLSVMPVSDAEWNRIESAAGQSSHENTRARKATK